MAGRKPFSACPMAGAIKVQKASAVSYAELTASVAVGTPTKISLLVYLAFKGPYWTNYILPADFV